MLLMPLVDRFNAASCLSSVRRGGTEGERKTQYEHLKREQKNIGDDWESDRMRRALFKSSVETDVSNSYLHMWIMDKFCHNSQLETLFE